MGGFVRFGTTLWSMIDCARAGNRPAMEKLSTTYRPAVVNFALQSGLTAEDAEDAAQETLIRLFGALPIVDPKRGKFRSLVLGFAKNVIHEIRRKRGRPAPADPRVAGLEREETFDRAWVQNIVLMALEELRKECQERGTPFYEAMRLQMEGVDHEEIARRIKAETKQVKSYIHQARQKIRKSVEAAIAEYTVESEYEEERAYLLNLMV